MSLLIGAALSFGITTVLLYKKSCERKQVKSKLIVEILIFSVSILMGGFYAASSWISYLLQIMWLYFIFILIFTFGFVFRNKRNY